MQAKRKRKLCNSLAGAVGNRAEVTWRNSARWLEHKPSELSTPAEIRGLDRLSLKCEGKNATFCKNVAARGPYVRWLERVCVNLQQKQRSAAEDSHSLAGAMGNRAEVSWRNSARWLEHKPSELSTLAEIRGLDRFYKKDSHIGKSPLLVLLIYTFKLKYISLKRSEM